MNNVHPVFAPILNNFRASTTDVLMAAYVQALKSHDWEYQYSDDHSVYSKGRDSFAKLQETQAQLDPHYTVWNAHCPAHHKK